MTARNLEDLDLNLLLVLDALGSELNATKAAKRIGLSQPAISRALARLRKYFNDQLFVHTAGGLSPTARAAALRAPLHDALATLGLALAAPTLELQDWTGAIRLAMLDMEEFLLLPHLLQRVTRLAPNLRLEAVPLLSLSVAQLQDANADFAIGPIAAARGPFIRQTLYTDHFVCVTNAANAVAANELTLEAYAGAKHLQLGLMHGGTPSQVDSSLKKSGIKRNVALRSQSFGAALYILAESNLILTTTSRVAARFAARANLKILPLPAPVDDMVVYQLWHERNKDDPRHKWFRHQLKEAAATEQESGSFLNRAGRPDSDFAMLRHRDARTKKLLEPSATGFETASV
jgi:DNA-binding transcriptional LysR family regulator